METFELVTEYVDGTVRSRKGFRSVGEAEAVARALYLGRSDVSFLYVADERGRDMWSWDPNG